MAIKVMKKGKGSGDDKLTVDVLKEGENEVIEVSLNSSINV